MSGVEAVGLVLAVFPLIVSAWNGYNEHCQPFKDWWRFEQTLANFLRPVVCEQVILRQSIEELLSPLVDSEEDMVEMCENTNSPLWRDTKLDQALRHRLASSYGVFFDTVVDMHKQLQKIMKILAVEDGNAGWLTNPEADWKVNYKRLKICFKKSRGEQCVGKLIKDNETIKSFVRSSRVLEPLRKQRKSRVGLMLERVRCAALNLHQVLSRGWKCNCQTSHQAILLLEQRPQSNTGQTQVGLLQFRLFFWDNGAMQHPWAETEVVLHTNDSTNSDPRDDKMSTLAVIQQSSSSINMSSGKVKKIMFAAPPVSTCSFQPSPAAKEIQDLCGIFGRPSTKETTDSLGYLSFDTINQYHLFRGNQTALPRDATLTMDRLLGTVERAADRRFAMRDRLRLAVVISSSVLQLWGTPWLNNYLSKESLEVQVSPQVTARTFVRGDFFSSRDQKTISQDSRSSVLRSQIVYTREVMLQLSIVLLELCFGQSLESQPFRKDYLKPDGTPSDYTDRMTALKWQEQVGGEMGHKYATVVSNCIDCRFGHDEPNLEDVIFRQSVHANVVEPLQEIAAVLN